MVAKEVISPQLVRHGRSLDRHAPPQPNAFIQLFPHVRYARPLTSLLKLLRDFAIVIEDGRIRHFWSSNAHHRRFLERALLDRRFAEILDSEAAAWLENALSGGNESNQAIHMVELADGMHSFAVGVMPIASTRGSAAAALIARDITARRASRVSLLQNQELLAHAEELAEIGSWELDIRTNTMNWSAHFHEMLGLIPSKGPVPDGYGSALIHPDDRERAERDAERARKDGQPFENELRFVTLHRGVRILQSRAVPIRDAAGRVVRIRGMSQDVTEQREAQEKLREQEALLAHAERIANFGSYQYDCVANVATLSPNLRKLYGLTPEEQWTSGDYWEHVHRDDRIPARAIMRKAIEEGESFEYVTRFVSASGSMRFHLVRGMPIPNTEGKATKRIGVVQDITDQVRVEQELREVSRQLMRARDDDQRRIARELHESAGQTLAALKMTLGRLRNSLPEGDTPERVLLRSAGELADAAVREVRTVSYLMHPPMLDERGLVPALRWFVAGFAERSGIQVRIEIPEDLPRQSQEIETTVFRVVQEALTNVHRYSGSPTAQIRVTCGEDEIVAEVRDQGCGVCLPGRTRERTPELGVGIAGMRERVKQLNGVFEIKSTAGKGTVIRAMLPFRSNELPKPVSSFQSAESLEQGRVYGA